mmetsp:Transcript_11633/g.26901  ORF Transcript_11633/g.26901 Transcript_11633/m.26901 type:complete len:379 (-) Transcript_11633:189-1325(-)
MAAQAEQMDVEEPKADGAAAEGGDEYVVEGERWTDEERVSYLRQNGVEITDPAEEKEKARQAAAVAAGGGGVVAFRYVRIPVNEAEPFEQLEAVLPLGPDGQLPGGDQIPALVKSAFGDRSKGINERVLRDHARTQLGEAAASLTPRALTEATLDGSVETFALARPAEANKYQGVYIYLDEVGVLKQLPPNPRGNALARSCGHQEAKFHGELYIGRVATRPAPMRNADLLLSDLDSDADWLKAAPAENFEYNVAMQEMQAQLQTTGNVQQMNMGGTKELPSGGDDQLQWTQTAEDVEVVIKVPEGTKGRDLAVTIKVRALSAKLKSGETLVDLKLAEDVHPDDSTWTVSGDGLCITLEKANGSTWHGLGEGPDHANHL